VDVYEKPGIMFTFYYYWCICHDNLSNVALFLNIQVKCLLIILSNVAGNYTDILLLFFSINVCAYASLQLLRAMLTRYIATSKLLFSL